MQAEKGWRGGGGGSVAPLPCPPGVFARPDVGSASPVHSDGSARYLAVCGGAALSSEGLEVFESETLGILLLTTPKHRLHVIYTAITLFFSFASV